MQFSDTPRQSVVAGRFYSGDAKELAEDVVAFLRLRTQKVMELQDKNVLCLLVPHAGYIFSGPVAGMTLGRVVLPDRLILLGPNHTGRGKPISVWSGGPWLTPLGATQTDEETATALVDADVGFSPDMQAHLQEHSLEVLIPFFQVMNPKVQITPVTISSLNLRELRIAGEALADVVLAAAVAGKRILLVVSSDMSHYLPHERAVRVDSMALEALLTLDAEHYFHTVRDNNISMCGVFPMTMALFALKKLGATNARVLAYATSGQTGKSVGADMSKVVGYAGVVVTE